ncbi:TrmB family transcriptional regulator [Halomicrobium salinisoli]|uniref:TrmB family transcriptional regulator n=1 Tax=Halomicrobium salinisoli TaxID=2878391 RepID=UPI001CF020D6|nr:TrmB family transcriptional regulator [Halomicrobium salinisoli]
MDTDRLHDALTRAGLTSYQADVYLALLELGSAPVVDVADRAGVPTSQTYDVVRSLEDRGFVETVERDRLHARATEPDVVLEELRGTGELLTDAADAIEDRWERPAPEDYRVSVVKHRKTVLDRARDAIADAAVSIEIALTPDQFEALRAALEQAAERGVVVRAILYGPAGDLDLADTTLAEVRHGALPGPFLAIVDRRQSYFAPNVHGDEPYGILLDDTILSFVLHWYFLTCVWVHSETVAVGVDRPTYVSIEEFIRDAAPLWYDGAAIEVTVSGHAPGTGERTTVSGVVVDVHGEDGLWPGTSPTYDELAGVSALVVLDDEELRTVGGWGAVYEDLEAEIIRVDGITYPESGTAGWPWPRGSDESPSTAADDEPPADGGGRRGFGAGDE